MPPAAGHQTLADRSQVVSTNDGQSAQLQKLAHARCQVRSDPRATIARLRRHSELNNAVAAILHRGTERLGRNCSLQLAFGGKAFGRNQMPHEGSCLINQIELKAAAASQPALVQNRRHESVADADELMSFDPHTCRPVAEEICCPITLRSSDAQSKALAGSSGAA